MSEDWVVDSLIGFLRSPVWSSPINDFIDENCVVFDPGDENKFAYNEVHNSYNALVEKLLDTFTSELGITAEQLAHACMQSSNLGAADQKQLEQVLAAGNFMLFKSLMVQKNIELEMQALSLIKNQLGHAPDAYDPNTQQPSAPPAAGENTEDVFQQALDVSKREFETQNSLDEEEMQKLIDLATQESLRLFEASEREKQLKIEKSKETGSTKEAPSVSVKQKSESEKEQPPSKPKEPTSPQRSSQQAPLVSLSPTHATTTSTSEAASMWLHSAKQECQQPGASTQQKVAVQVPADLKSREAYLKRQRDHLLKIKQQARAKELDAYNSSTAPNPKKPSPSTSRPTPSPSTDKPATTKSPDKATAAAKSPVSSEKKGFYTGALCSVIASKLKEQS